MTKITNFLQNRLALITVALFGIIVGAVGGYFAGRTVEQPAQTGNVQMQSYRRFGGNSGYGQNSGYSSNSSDNSSSNDGSSSSNATDSTGGNL